MLGEKKPQKSFFDMASEQRVSNHFLRSSPKFPVKRVAEVINYTPPLILAYLEVLP